MTSLAFLGLLFLAIHAIPATSLRARAISTMGQGAYMGLFSALSLVIFIVWTYAFGNAAHDTPLWIAPAWWLWLKALLMLFAFLLLAGSVTAPNPTAPNAGNLLDRPDIATGIMAITRHPMMWAFAIWGLTHLISQPNLRGLFFFGIFAATAISGAILQEKRKAATYGERWQHFVAKTSFVPFMAILQGRAHLTISELGWWWIGLAILLWAAILHLHSWLFNAIPLPIGPNFA